MGLKSYVLVVLLLIGFGLIGLTVYKYYESSHASSNVYEARFTILVQEFSKIENIQKISSSPTTTIVPGYSFAWDQYPREDMSTPLYSLYQKTKIILVVDGVKSESKVYNIIHASWSVGVTIKGLKPGQHSLQAYLYIWDDYKQEWIQKSSYTTTFQIP